MRIIRCITADDRLAHAQQFVNGAAREIIGSIFNPSIQLGQKIEVRKLLAPFVPTDIICVGRNYLAASIHAGSDQREDPDRAATQPDHMLEVFLKPSTALAHPNDPILIPQLDHLDANLDCEGELAMVIARDTRDISEENALECVLGYTIANDVTARAFQTPTGPPLWMRGKGFDTFCPLGPTLVTRNEIPDPQNLTVRTIINGQVVRDGHTSQMIRTVPQIIATLSRHMTIRQGAVILTGAPPVVATSSITTGSIVDAEIAGIGRLTNVCRAS